MFSDPPFLNGTKRTVNSSDEQELIDNLHPGVAYNFTVAAFNKTGLGSESEPLPVTTLEEGTVALNDKKDWLIVTNQEIFCRCF